MTDIFNTSEKNREIEATEKRTRQREINDVKRLLKMPEGRRFFWRLLSIAAIFQDKFNSNAKIEDRNLGRASIGLEILEDINAADVMAFAKMQQEYISEQQSKKALKEIQTKKENENG